MKLAWRRKQETYENDELDKCVGKNRKGVHATNNREEEKEEEMALIPKANTSVDPGTVVVHSLHTTIQHQAYMKYLYIFDIIEKKKKKNER